MSSKSNGGGASTHQAGSASCDRNTVIVAAVVIGFSIILQILYNCLRKKQIVPVSKTNCKADETKPEPVEQEDQALRPEQDDQALQPISEPSIGNVYTTDKIIQYEEISTTPQDVDKDIDYASYDRLSKVHEDRISGWNQTTAKLQAISTQIAQSNHVEFADDEQKENEMIFNDVYQSYTKCRKLMDEQQKRLNKVPTKEYARTVFQNVNQLNHQTEFNDAMTASNVDEKKKLDASYESVKRDRISLEEQIADLVKQCNAKIEAENNLLRQIKHSEDLSDELRTQREKLKSRSNTFNSLVDEYEAFEQKNNEYIQSINEHFSKTWTNFESTWWDWSARDIVSWFKYKAMGKDTMNVNWSKVLNELTTRGINGKQLQHFNDSHMDLIGVKDFQIALYLMKQIQRLRAKYRQQKEVENEESDNDAVRDGPVDDTKQEEVEPIPSKYVCPLCKKIMKDPVLAFDGNTYERECIVKYLKEERRSPVTNAKATTLKVFTNHPLREEIKSFCDENGFLGEGQAQ